MTVTLPVPVQPPTPLRQDDVPARPRRPRRSLSSWSFLVLLALWTALSLGPLVWMLVNSLRGTTDIVARPLGSPSLNKTGNYSVAWVDGDLGQALLNSLLVSGGAVVLGGVCSFLAGFAISRGRLPLRGPLLTFFLVGLMIPIFSLLIPILLQFQSLDLISNRWGLVLVYAGFSLSLGIFLFVGAFDSIPSEYLEAAFLDGCSVPRALTAVLLPMMRPTIATFSILTFLNAYNDFVFALVLNNEPALRTLPVAILQFSGIFGTQYDVVFAAVSIATLPPLIAYLCLRKQVQTSVAMGGRTG